MGGWRELGSLWKLVEAPQGNRDICRHWVLSIMFEILLSGINMIESVELLLPDLKTITANFNLGRSKSQRDVLNAARNTCRITTMIDEEEK